MIKATITAFAMVLAVSTYAEACGSGACGAPKQKQCQKKEQKCEKLKKCNKGADKKECSREKKCEKKQQKKQSCKSGQCGK